MMLLLLLIKYYFSPSNFFFSLLAFSILKYVFPSKHNLDDTLYREEKMVFVDIWRTKTIPFEIKEKKRRRLN